MVPHYYRGELSYVAKDPVTLSYYRLGEVEYVTLECFRQGMNVEHIQREVKKRTGYEISAIEIYKFANQLRSSSLLKSKGMEDVERLARNRRHARRAKFRQVVSNYLFITIPLWDPDKLLEKLLPYFRFFLNTFVYVCALVVMGAALWVVMENFAVLVADAFSLLSGWNLLILSMVIFSVKFFHEMGHALTCKHFGGEVHAIGPAFLVFQPCMFTDATDSWLFPSKWDRMGVSLAGIVAELLLASVAALVWISSDPGLLKQVAYTTMVACSVHTLLFNANPLLRFDGYYILSDLVEIPNLRLKTSRYLGYLFDRYVLGLKTTFPTTQPGERMTYAVYGVARFLFRMLIFISIGLFLYSIFEPLGVFMGITSVYGMIVMPMWKRGKELARQYSAGGVRIRYLLVIALVLAVLTGFWFIPMAYTIQAPCVVAPADIAVVRTAVRGKIRQILVEPGQRVTEGQPLVEMENPDLVYRAQEVAEEIEAVKARLARALVADPAGYKVQLRQKKKLVEELEELEELIARLVLRAPDGGVIVDLHLVEIKPSPAQHAFVQFPNPDDRADLRQFEGTTVAPGTGILGVASTGGFLFETFVYEHDISSLSVGDEMVCMLAADPSQEFKSRVQSIRPVDVKAIENVGITLADVGYIPVKPSPDGRQEPLITIFMVRSLLQENTENLQWGLTGKAQMTYGAGPMGSFFFGRIVRALRLRLQSL